MGVGSWGFVQHTIDGSSCVRRTPVCRHHFGQSWYLGSRRIPPVLLGTQRPVPLLVITPSATRLAIHASTDLTTTARLLTNAIFRQPPAPPTTPSIAVFHRIRQPSDFVCSFNGHPTDRLRPRVIIRTSSGWVVGRRTFRAETFSNHEMCPRRASPAKGRCASCVLTPVSENRGRTS